MSTELKNKIEEDIKKRNLTPSSVLQTIKNSLNGIKCYAKDGKSILLYLFGVIVEIIMGIIYNINGLEWILIVCILGIILSIELINTAIEATCDAIGKEYNNLIKIAKDCGSGATFIVFLVAIILNLIIFLPKIVALF
ncbi:MAG: diacylglycerol kinase [Firmicutes bacterium]|nr:diacylglycerol kinase [Bacillota bacterium]